MQAATATAGDAEAADAGGCEQHLLAIPEDEHRRLLAETETYLAELRAEVGEPSQEHKRRARALVESLKRA